MALDDASLRDRFRGCLLGLAVGDALGAEVEAQTAEGIRARFPTVRALLGYPREEIWYTDDTQMALGLAEALLAEGRVVEERLCQAFVANYVPSRGYGWGARAVLDAMEEGRDYRAVAEQHFPGGSYGNGAAMRVAPVGMLFRDDVPLLWEQARLSALPTHRLAGLFLGILRCPACAEFILQEGWVLSRPHDHDDPSLLLSDDPQISFLVADSALFSHLLSRDKHTRQGPWSIESRASARFVR